MTIHIFFQSAIARPFELKVASDTEQGGSIDPIVVPFVDQNARIRIMMVMESGQVVAAQQWLGAKRSIKGLELDSGGTRGYSRQSWAKSSAGGDYWETGRC